ncbi:ISL3 family transposase [Pseudonocardia kujensis]|uniref:ISL3 family transposase n=1 Tax=Pseudonocardia kujensis TaxID=1128675 RepID=UPI001E3FCA4A|nr:ISL3 family transposase [Pseudonocardia kujensis]MCE0764926.1 ISL3 family transposase [Pseudonocardia kujensis]
MRARCASADAACPSCGTRSRRVHAWQVRQLSDLPVAGRSMVVELRVRRLVCAEQSCPQRTFREQVPPLAARYARRTLRLTGLIGQTAVRLAGRAGSAVLGLLGATVSRSTVLRTLMALSLPATTSPVPSVLSVDDVALCRGRRYMTMVIDPVTHRRIEVLPDRKAATLADWLSRHPGVKVVCRDGSAAYAEAIGDGAPDAVQVSDRWHLWHGLGGAVEKTVIAHSGCWRPDVDTDPARSVPTTAAPSGGTRHGRPLTERTRARHAQVHQLLGQGVGLLGCARRLGWASIAVFDSPSAAASTILLRRASACEDFARRDHRTSVLRCSSVRFTSATGRPLLGTTGGIPIFSEFQAQDTRRR